MCVTPNKLANGQLVACRVCWQCRANKVNDWVGRNIAESKTARKAQFISLTYGRDSEGNEHHPRSVLLTYRDVQNFIKLLRRHGYPCRYMAVGEYGSMNGRAHWHLLIYWQGDHPAWQEKKNIHVDEWIHGHVYVEPMTDKAVRYACKYIQKTTDNDTHQYMMAMSKKPPLGTAYFEQLAARYVQHGVSPQSLEYSFPGDFHPIAKKRNVYRLMRHSADHFIETFLRLWREKRKDHPPTSEVVTEYEDRMQREYMEEARVEMKYNKRKVERGAKPDFRWPGYGPSEYNEHIGCWVAVHTTDGRVIKWDVDPEDKGRMSWQRVNDPRAAKPKLTKRYRDRRG